MTQGKLFEISPEQIEAFGRDGVICLRGVLDVREVDLLRGAVARQMKALGTSDSAYDFEDMARQVWQAGGEVEAGAARRFDLRGLRSLLASDPFARPLREEGAPEAGGMFFYDAGGSQRDAAIRDVAFGSALPALAGALLAAGQIQFWEDTTFVKAPRTRQKTAFHQDLGYFQIEGDQCVIAWIPLDPAGNWNGVTRYVRGSHKWAEEYAPNIFISQTPFPAAQGPRCPDIEAAPETWNIVSFEVSPGDVIFHHVRTVHGAGGNPSETWRRAMSFRYCGEDVCYREKPGALPPPGDAAGHMEGDRLSPDVFPVVWRRE